MTVVTINLQHKNTIRIEGRTKENKVYLYIKMYVLLYFYIKILKIV